MRGRHVWLDLFRFNFDWEWPVEFPFKIESAPQSFVKGVMGSPAQITLAIRSRFHRPVECTVVAVNKRLKRTSTLSLSPSFVCSTNVSFRASPVTTGASYKTVEIELVVESLLSSRSERQQSLPRAGLERSVDEVCRSSQQPASICHWRQRRLPNALRWNAAAKDNTHTRTKHSQACWPSTLVMDNASSMHCCSRTR